MSIDDQIRDHPSCGERIREHFDSRNEYLEKLSEAMENDEPYDGYEDARDAWNEFPMGISTETIIQVKIELSWGGPSDYITVDVYEDGEIKSAEYHFADWFDHAKMNIPKDTYMYDYVVNIVDACIER